MATVTQTTKIVHYAAYVIDGHDVCGTAELLRGSGYLFRADGETAAYLVSYKDQDLCLYGLVDVADAQLADDTRVGGSRVLTLLAR